MARLDENFICGRCQGILFEIGKENELSIYQCPRCKIGFQYECPVCHNPRTIWAIPRKLCFICCKNAKQGTEKVFKFVIQL